MAGLWTVGLWVLLCTYCKSSSLLQHQNLPWIYHKYDLIPSCFISCFSLSGNPPFYDETEEENTDLHNRIIFCRIVAGEFEFDTPYWDDISPAGTVFMHRAIKIQLQQFA